MNPLDNNLPICDNNLPIRDNNLPTNDADFTDPMDDKSTESTLETTPVTSTLEAVKHEDTIIPHVLPLIDRQVAILRFAKHDMSRASAQGLSVIASAIILESLLAKQRTMFDDVIDFHEKFGLTPPAAMSEELVEFRIKAMQEELNEYVDADTDTDTLDALIDLIYFALGTAYTHGYARFNEAWRRVHEANMRKVRAVKKADSKRNTTLDVVKPKGWVAPNLEDLI